jgi:signal transduction histidine kinase
LQAETGEEGIAQLEESPIDCVLLDYSLPGKNGVSILRTIRANYPHMAVIMLTGQGNEAVAVEVMKAGAQDYILKERINQESLYRVINRAVTQCYMIQRIEEQRYSLELFTKALAHDLREPLRNVESLCKLLEDREALSPKGNTYLNEVYSSISRMEALLSSVSDYTRLDAVYNLPEPQNVAIDEVLQEVLADLKHLIKENSAKITYSAMPVVRGHFVQLKQLFENLIANAIRYSENMPIIHIGVHNQDDKWQFYVRDNGSGVPEKYREEVFTPFKRFVNSPASGTGLGLAICKRVVEVHKGRIWCDSIPNQGSVFSFTLPKLRDAKQAPPTYMPEPAVPHNLPQSPEGQAGEQIVVEHSQHHLANVLLVEDNPLDIELLRVLLMERSQLHFNLHIAHDGEEALAKLRHMPEPIDLVLLDINMPRMDGFSCLEAMKQDKKLHYIPVIMLSTSDDYEDRQQARDLGAAAYMVKPADYRQFSDALCHTHNLQLIQENNKLHLLSA